MNIRYRDMFGFGNLRCQSTMFLVHTKTQIQRFQIPLFQESFVKSSILLKDYCAR